MGKPKAGKGWEGTSLAGRKRKPAASHCSLPPFFSSILWSYPLGTFLSWPSSIRKEKEETDGQRERKEKIRLLFSFWGLTLSSSFFLLPLAQGKA